MLRQVRASWSITVPFPPRASASAPKDEHSFGGLMERRGTRRTVKSGDPLFLEGAPAECVFQVVSGSVRCSQYTADGLRQTDAILTSGDGIGLRVYRTYPFTAEAVGDVEVLCCPRAVFEMALCDDSGVRESVVQILASEEMAQPQQAA